MTPGLLGRDKTVARESVRALFIPTHDRKAALHDSGLGCFATQPIAKNKRIIDYAGEKINNRESLKREKRYLKKGHIWCFKLNRLYVRDAAVGGNVARYINHACKPNCYTQIIGDTIWIRAARNIAQRRRADLRLLDRRRRIDSVPLPSGLQDHDSDAGDLPARLRLLARIVESDVLLTAPPCADFAR